MKECTGLDGYSSLLQLYEYHTIYAQTLQRTAVVFSSSVFQSRWVSSLRWGFRTQNKRAMVRLALFG